MLKYGRQRNPDDVIVLSITPTDCPYVDAISICAPEDAGPNFDILTWGEYIQKNASADTTKLDYVYSNGQRTNVILLRQYINECKAKLATDATPIEFPEHLRSVASLIIYNLCAHAELHIRDSSTAKGLCFVRMPKPRKSRPKNQLTSFQCHRDIVMMVQGYLYKTHKLLVSIKVSKATMALAVKAAKRLVPDVPAAELFHEPSAQKLTDLWNSITLD